MVHSAVQAAVAGMLIASAPAPAVALTAPGHAPKVQTRWSYTVSVRVGGKPAAAKITEAIVDPIGGVHPVEFGKSTKTITNFAFKGTFTDYITWPSSSRGVPLTLRITVKVGSVTRVIAYRVTPR